MLYNSFYIHSIVDVITNSSTVIYTKATEATISAFKEIINHLLSIASPENLSISSPKMTCDDLFIFRLVPELSTLKHYMLDSEDKEHNEDSEWYKSLSNDCFTRNKQIKEKILDIIKKYPLTDWYVKCLADGESSIQLYIFAKDSSNEHIASVMEHLLTTIKTEESYC